MNFLNTFIKFFEKMKVNFDEFIQENSNYVDDESLTDF